MYEHHTQPMLTRKYFLLRMLWHLLAASLVIAGSLIIGIIGYHSSEGLSWLDSLLNAAMILGGMGPVTELHTATGKIFASFYALFSGVIFLVIAGILIAPVAHRLLHRLHLEIGEEETSPEN